MLLTFCLKKVTCVLRVLEECRLQPITPSAVWMMRCSLPLSLAEAAGYQTEMEEVRMDSMLNQH